MPSNFEFDPHPDVRLLVPTGHIPDGAPVSASFSEGPFRFTVVRCDSDRQPNVNVVIDDVTDVADPVEQAYFTISLDALARLHEAAAALLSTGRKAGR